IAAVERFLEPRPRTLVGIDREVQPRGALTALKPRLPSECQSSHRVACIDVLQDAPILRSFAGPISHGINPNRPEIAKFLQSDASFTHPRKDGIVFAH